MPDKQKRVEDAVDRAVLIARRIAARQDLDVRRRIEAFDEKLDGVQKLGIAADAFRQIEDAGIKMRLVFAHPQVLQAIPEASLYYRGIALLSRKRVQEIVGGIDTWETSPPTARVTYEKALRLCQLYNAVISSIILDRTDWTLENGYRNILANLGITEDGAMRNIIGQEAESAIKGKMLDWARVQGLVGSEQTETEGWELADGVHMYFGSEPDISFETAGTLAVLIEVKGGKDPAGALERLGAVKNTFDETPPGCRNFLVVGVVTPTMRERLDEMRMERDFNIDDLLDDEAVWLDFMNEVFHHSLRITPEVRPP